MNVVFTLSNFCSLRLLQILGQKLKSGQYDDCLNEMSKYFPTINDESWPQVKGGLRFGVIMFQIM